MCTQTEALDCKDISPVGRVPAKIYDENYFEKKVFDFHIISPYWLGGLAVKSFGFLMHSPSNDLIWELRAINFVWTQYRKDQIRNYCGVKLIFTNGLELFPVFEIVTHRDESLTDLATANKEKYDKDLHTHKNVGCMILKQISKWIKKNNRWI